MTATVLAADTQTAFYVDPTYTGGSNDGSSVPPMDDDLVSGGTLQQSDLGYN